jgi:hypothetical protein
MVTPADPQGNVDALKETLIAPETKGGVSISQP